MVSKEVFREMLGIVLTYFKSLTSQLSVSEQCSVLSDEQTKHPLKDHLIKEQELRCRQFKLTTTHSSVFVMSFKLGFIHHLSHKGSSAYMRSFIFLLKRIFFIIDQ